MASLIRPTTKGFAGTVGVTPVAMKGVSYSPVGGPYVNAKGIWRAPAGGPFTMIYSTPNGVLTGGGPQIPAASGASPNGRAQITATAVPGGNNSGSLGYSWGGGVNLSYSGNLTSVLTGYYDFTGVPNGWTSSAKTDTGVYCDITDLITGATWRTDTITMGPLTWTNTIPAEDPLSLTADSVSGYVGGFGSFTSTVFASASTHPAGGSLSYTSWTHTIIGGDTGISINNINLQNPTFSKSIFCPSLSLVYTYCDVRVNLTDSEGHSTSATYTVTLTAESVND